MARPKKNTEIIAVEPAVEKSAVMVLSKKESTDMMIEIVKSDYPEFDGDLLVVLGERAINYLYARFNGMVHHEAIEIYNVSPVEVELWSKKPEFVSVLNVLKSAEASMAESRLWQNVMDSDSSGLPTMFARRLEKPNTKKMLKQRDRRLLMCGLA